MHVSLLDLALALAVGAVLGAWFFGGLLWTVCRLPSTRHPVLLVLASFVIRLAGVLAGLIWLVGRHWLLPAVALISFLVMRYCTLRTRGYPRSRIHTE